MMFQYYPFCYLYIISAFFSGFTAYYAWKHQKVRSARTFSILMSLVTWWIVFEFLEVTSINPQNQLLFLHIEYLAIPWIPGFLFWFSLEFGGFEKYCTRKNLLIIFIIPVLVFVSFFTDSIVHLFYQNVSFVVINGLTIMSVVPGIMFRVLNITNIVAILFCFFIIFRVFLQSSSVFRPQMILTFCAVLILCAGLAGYFVIPRLYPNFNILSMSFGFIGILILTAIFRFQFLDLMYIPYYSIFENLEEGILVLDPKNRIIEINKKASELLMLDQDTIKGQDLKFAKTVLSGRYDVLTQDTYNSIRIVDESQEGATFYVEMYPVLDASLHMQSRMIIIRDITEMTKTYKALEEAGKKLNLLNSITRHDILNQVAIISGYAELMGECQNNNLDYTEHLSRILNASDSIKHLIRFTATYQDLGVTKPTWQNVSDVVQNAWNTLHPPEKVTLRIDTNIVIFADMLLEKVFFNLMDNSLRHGDTVTEISVLSYPEADKTVLVYQDNGRGVLPEQKEKIFSQGFGKNTGYGLYLVAEILSITSIIIHETGIYGEGARFEMIIPPNGTINSNHYPSSEKE